MPITDVEWVFRSTNPKELDPGGKGICKGMVILFILALAEMADDRTWFPEISNGIFIDPERRGGFYVNAATLHIQGLALAARLRGRIPDPDANELVVVQQMYQASKLEAVPLWDRYVDPRRGAALAEVIHGARYDWFHVSLRSMHGGHSLAVWRSAPDHYLLFDPNAGAAQFLSYERFRAILVEEFTPEVADEGDGMYAEYTRICCWGIEIGAAALPPPPPPPH